MESDSIIYIRKTSQVRLLLLNLCVTRTTNSYLQHFASQKLTVTSDVIENLRRVNMDAIFGIFVTNSCQFLLDMKLFFDQLPL